MAFIRIFSRALSGARASGFVIGMSACPLDVNTALTFASEVDRYMQQLDTNAWLDGHDPCSLNSSLNAALFHASSATLPTRKFTARRPWISFDTLLLIDQRDLARADGDFDREANLSRQIKQRTNQTKRVGSTMQFRPEIRKLSIHFVVKQSRSIQLLIHCMTKTRTHEQKHLQSILNQFNGQFVQSPLSQLHHRIYNLYMSIAPMFRSKNFVQHLRP